MRLLSILILSFSMSAFAGTPFNGKIFQGQETVNQQLTGNACTVQIGEMNSLKNMANCYDVEMNLIADSSAMNDVLSLRSRITNYNQPSFPARKTCALNKDGSLTGEDVFLADSASVYTPYYAGMKKVGFTQYDYFLKISPETQLPNEAAINMTGILSEKLVECVNLHPIQ